MLDPDVAALVMKLADRLADDEDFLDSLDSHEWALLVEASGVRLLDRELAALREE